MDEKLQIDNVDVPISPLRSINSYLWVRSKRSASAARTTWFIVV